MNDGPKYEAADVVPSIRGPSPTAASARTPEFMYWVAMWPSKMFLKYVGSEPCT